MKIFSPEGTLNRDLPQARWAEQQFIRLIVQQSSGRSRQSRRLAGSPKQDMGIQQQFHGRPLNNCSISRRIHLIEIIGYDDLSRHEAQAANLATRRSVQSRHLGHWFARLGDDERFALTCLLNQFRELRLGFVNIYLFHMN